MERFFKNVIDPATSQIIKKLVVVTHLVPGSDEFLLALHKIFPIAALIPKPTSIDQRILDVVNKHVPILNYRREQIIADSERFLTDLSHELGISNLQLLILAVISHMYYPSWRPDIAISSWVSLKTRRMVIRNISFS